MNDRLVCKCAGTVVWLALALLFLGACRNNDPSVVQPDRFASAAASTTAPSVGSPSSHAASTGAAETPSGSASAPLRPYASVATAAPAPLVPFARGKGPADVKRPKAETKPRVEPEPPPVTLGKVELLSAGALPHRELRLTSEVGHTEQMQMTMALDIGMEIAGKKAPGGALPPMMMTMDMKVTEAEPGGDIGYQFVLTKTDVPPAKGVEPKVMNLMKKGLSKLIGLNGRVVVSARGLTREAKMILPDKADPQTAQIIQGMEQAMNQISAPFPKEPVGKGGRWRYATRMTQNGVSLTQEATYVLTDIAGDTVTCDVRIEQTAPKQKVASPLGVTVDLLSLSSKGEGKTKLRLDQLSPVTSVLALDSAVKMAIPDGAATRVMTMTTAMQLRVQQPAKLD